jgi:hypothetical protein
MSRHRQPPHTGSEPELALGFLDYQRDVLRAKTDGLDASQLDTTLAPSTMTLGGMLKHMAFVEDWWFSVMFRDNEPQPPFDSVDWDADWDWDWHSAVDDSPEQLRALWESMVDRSRELVAGAGMEAVAVRTTKRGDAISLRWLVLHMIEEYARHLGHADLIRESIDGSTGD